MRQKRTVAWVHERGTKLVSHPVPGGRWVHLCGWPVPITPLRGEARRPAQPRPTVRSGLSRGFVARRVGPPTPAAPRTVRPGVSPAPANVVLRVLARKALTPVPGSTGAPGVRAAEPVWLTPDRPSFTRRPVGSLCAATSELFSGLRVRHLGRTIGGWPRCVAFRAERREQDDARRIQSDGIAPNPTACEDRRGLAPVGRLRTC